MRRMYVGMHSADTEPDYCGCCGRRCGNGRFWCVKCTAAVGHLGPAHLHAWDRTYEATHSKPCPFAEVEP